MNFPLSQLRPLSVTYKVADVFAAVAGEIAVLERSNLYRPDNYFTYSHVDHLREVLDVLTEWQKQGVENICSEQPFMSDMEVPFEHDEGQGIVRQFSSHKVSPA